MADFIPSAQQNAFFDWVDTGYGQRDDDCGRGRG